MAAGTIQQGPDRIEGPDRPGRRKPSRVSTLHIRTPEGITFSVLLAGPVARFLAWIIDFACISVITMVVNAGIGLAAVVSADVAQAAGIVSFFVISIGYGIFCEWYLKGQTIGKRLLSMRVMDIQGLRLQPSQIIIRNLLRFIDSLPACYLVGGAACLVSPFCQRLGDLAANTVVVREPRMPRPDLDQILPPKYNSLRAYPHLTARLRQRTSPREADIALQALLRRDELAPMARIELFSETAAHFRQLVTFPQEALEGISDEQFVRNVVDVLFTAAAPR